MIVAYVEPSGESEELAAAEIAGAARALGGGATDPDLPGLVRVELPAADVVAQLAGRLALAHRCLVPVEPGVAIDRAVERAGRIGRSAEFRRLGRSRGTADAELRALGDAYRTAGGTIDLERPERRFVLAPGATGAPILLEQAATVDRPATAARRMPSLPFQRPVSLAPRLARAVANLAEIRLGDRVVDPFVGTGALLAEAALLHAHTYGIDLDATMVVGALKNFAHLGVSPGELVQGDAGTVDFRRPDGRFDAVVTDPPYGRASTTGGESSADVVARVVPRWAARLRPGGRLVVVVPSGTAALPIPGRPERTISVRVHRSLTREFRVYRAPDGPTRTPS